MTFFDDMIAKEVSAAVKNRTKENMEKFHMSLADAFNEAARAFSEKGSELYDAWYADDFRAYIPSAYQEKYLDFEKYPLKYKMKSFSKEKDKAELIKATNRLGGEVANKLYTAYKTHLKNILPEVKQALAIINEQLEPDPFRSMSPYIEVEGNDGLKMLVTDQGIAFSDPDFSLNFAFPLSLNSVKEKFYFRSVDVSFEERYESHLKILKGGVAIADQLSSLSTQLAVSAAKVQREHDAETHRQKQRFAEFHDELANLRKALYHRDAPERGIQPEQDELGEER